MSISKMFHFTLIKYHIHIILSFILNFKFKFLIIKILPFYVNCVIINKIHSCIFSDILLLIRLKEFLYLKLFLARSEVDAFHHRVFEVQPVFFRIILASGAFFGGSSLPFFKKYIL